MVLNHFSFVTRGRVGKKGGYVEPRHTIHTRNKTRKLEKRQNSFPHQPRVIIQWPHVYVEVHIISLVFPIFLFNENNFEYILVTKSCPQLLIYPPSFPPLSIVGPTVPIL